jgi:ferredoxin
MKFRVRIDESRCIGAGRCVAQAPDLFDQREDDGIVVLLQDSPDASLYDRAVRAAAQCPARVIEIGDMDASRGE